MDSNFTQTQSPAAFVVQDVSPRVQELMRRIDRQPPGTIFVEITKDEVKAGDWTYRIYRLEDLDRGYLSRHNNRSNPPE